MTAYELLVRCLGRCEPEPLAAELERLDDAAWTRLVDAALWHGVGALLHVRLLALPGRPAPPRADPRLRDQYVHCLLQNEAIREQLRALLVEASALGCRVLCLKGAYLAHCAYEDAGARSMNDIDFLVLPEDVEAFQDHLLALGFAPTEPTQVDYHLDPVALNGSPPVELHHDLADREAPFRTSLVSLWSSATHTDLGDFVLPHPAPEDVLLHLCAHTAYNHGFTLGVRGACDVDAMVSRLSDQLDWDRFVDTANEDGRARYAYATLLLASRLLGTAIPEGVITALEHEPSDDRIVSDAVALALHPADAIPNTVGAIRHAHTLPSKLKALWGGVFPSPARMRQMYSIPPGSPMVMAYYFVRPFDLVVRRGRQVLGMAIGSRLGRRMSEGDDRQRRIRAWARMDRGGAPGI